MFACAVESLPKKWYIGAGHIRINECRAEVIKNEEKDGQEAGVPYPSFVVYKYLFSEKWFHCLTVLSFQESHNREFQNFELLPQFSGSRPLDDHSGGTPVVHEVKNSFPKEEH